MTIKFFPAVKGEKSSLLAKFLSRYRIKHELISPDDASARNAHKHGVVPALEIDGRLFVDPNDGVLKKVLHLE